MRHSGDASQKTFQRASENTAGVDKRGDASVDSEYKAAVHRASKPLSEWDPAKSMSAAGQTREPRTLEQCFELFSAIQQLGSDGYSCSACNEDNFGAPRMTAAKKRTLIFDPPAILTVHLKRFRQIYSGNYVKANDHIEYPKLLDLTPYCSQIHTPRIQSKLVLYSLYGVIVHTGTLQSGHYTAYVKQRTRPAVDVSAFLQQDFIDRRALADKQEFVRFARRCAPTLPAGRPDYPEPPDQWYMINDHDVRECCPSEVDQKSAYLLFYERVQ